MLTAEHNWNLEERVYPRMFSKIRRDLKKIGPVRALDIGDNMLVTIELGAKINRFGFYSPDTVQIRHAGLNLAGAQELYVPALKDKLKRLGVERVTEALYYFGDSYKDSGVVIYGQKGKPLSIIERVNAKLDGRRPEGIIYRKALATEPELVFEAHGKYAYTSYHEVCELIHETFIGRQFSTSPNGLEVIAKAAKNSKKKRSK